MRQRPTSFRKIHWMYAKQFCNGTHSLNEKLSREWNEEREMRERKKRFAIYAKIKVIKWFGVCLVLVLVRFECAHCIHTMHIHTTKPFDTHSFHIHLFVFAATSVCAHEQEAHSSTVVLETLTRIINISNNKPIWARFKTAKVLNAYYLFGVCCCSVHSPLSFGSSSAAHIALFNTWNGEENYINTTI